jgi:uncharacterized protein
VRLEGEQTLLRLHLSNFLRWHTGPLYEAVVGRARHEHLAGATVLSGTLGFIGGGRLLGQDRPVLGIERPVIVELVDRETTLRRFLDTLEPMLAGQPVLVTLERAHVVRYGGPPAEAPA